MADWLLLVIILAFLAVMAIIGWIRGFSKSLVSALTIVFAVLLVILVSPPVKSLIQTQTDWQKDLSGKLSEQFFSTARIEEDVTNFARSLPLPDGAKEKLCEHIISGQDLEEKKAVVCDYLAEWIITILLDVVLLIVAAILMFLLGRLLIKAAREPGLRALDGLFGAALAVFVGLLIVDFFFMIRPLFTGTAFGSWVNAQIASSKILKWLSENNVIAILLNVLEQRL